MTPYSAVERKIHRDRVGLKSTPPIVWSNKTEMSGLCEKEFPPLGMAAPASSKESKEPDEDWQIISTGDENDDHAENDVSEDETNSAAVVVVQGSPKILRHCASSPDLRAFHHILEEDEEEEKVEDSSFAMVSNVGSVVSAWSGKQTFRDAFLASPVREDKVDENDPTETSTDSAPRPYRKPKIVVTKPTNSMRRCAKSSPNLVGLTQNHHDDEEILGDTDANEFYHRKAKGAQGRANGLKLRPDEAKRKAFAVNKRNMQRQGK